MGEANVIHEAADGQQLFVRRWGPEADVTGVIQVLHGLAEHSARYGRVAEVFGAAGWATYAVDHRGHGHTAADHGRYGVARPGGWGAIVDDVLELRRRIGDEHPGVPVVLLGHSMGSLIAQAVLQRGDAAWDGVVLSATSGALEGGGDVVALAAAVEEAEGAEAPSELAAAMFDGFNAPFAGPDATGYEWLSKDPHEVSAYVADPWCGDAVSNGFVHDMLAGMVAMWDAANEARLPRGVPFLLLTGDQDPVSGGGESVRELVGRYEAMGVGPVTAHYVAGGRHELLNETERDAVHELLVDWIGATLAGRSTAND